MVDIQVSFVLKTEGEILWKKNLEHFKNSGTISIIVKRFWANRVVNAHPFVLDM